MTFWRQLTAAAGALLSGEASDSDAADPPPEGSPPAPDVHFTIAVIALGAKLAKADGAVTPNERAVFNQVFRAPKRAEKEAERVFEMAGRTTLGFESYARELARRWRAHPDMLADVVDGLFAIAAADGVFDPDEIAYLTRVSRIFGLSEATFKRVKRRWMGPEADDPYVILGVDRDVSDEELRRAYRRAAAANHPDTARAQGQSAEAERLANAKMTIINEAYRRIRAERGLVRAGND